MTRVATTGPNDPCEVHAPDCQDLKNRRKFTEGHGVYDVESWDDVAIHEFGDTSTDLHEWGTPEWLDLCRSDFAGMYRVMPCAPELPQS